MAAQNFENIRIPFTNMSFTPDVPSTALGANEYNDGINVETDVRGVRSIAGDIEILTLVPGTPTFVSGSFRADGDFWFIAATDEGYWWANNGAGWTDITPPQGPFANYAQTLNITESWNGTVGFFNDSLNPPMFWPDADATPGVPTALVMYSNLLPLSIIDNDPNGIVYVNPTTQRITLADTLATAPYSGGEYIVITGVSTYYNGTFEVVSSTTTTIDYLAVPGSTFPGEGGTVSPQYSWNYNPNWKSVVAGWMRLYNTPNVGSILIAGNLTATDLNDVVTNYPVTAQWSQSFGLNQAPLTWTPTITNVANQLDVPLSGASIDGFALNGQFFLMSYWDTVVFSPLNYSTTSAPILGVKFVTSGRGLLSTNCWALADQTVYGVDSRDIWVFDGNTFKGIANQRVKNWFYDDLATQYIYQVFMICNTQKNQIELYYPNANAVGGRPNRMLSYRFDIDVWNPPREITNATFATESPVWPLGANTTPNLGLRTIVYARGEANVKLVQKDTGTSFIGNTAISSRFRRDNIKILPNYSSHIYVHRVLPEVVNLNDRGIQEYPSTGNITITVEGAMSVANTATFMANVDIPIATNYPWAQIDQSESRVTTLEIKNTSNVNIWMCNATTWQYSKVEDDR